MDVRYLQKKIQRRETTLEATTLQKFQAWLQEQGVPDLEAAWLASLWAHIARRLMAPVGMSARQEQGETYIYLHVPQREDGLRFRLDDLKNMEDPVAELTDLVRTRLLS